MPLPTDFQAFLAAFGSAKFRQLHESQAWVLSKYSSDFSSQRDVAVELPTGAGKSLISLLIGEAWRRDGKKVAVLSANKTLARQMQAEAALLGVPVVLMEGKGVEIPVGDKRAYHRASSIAVMNYWVYFNQNPVLDAADLVFMDDAHLAEHCLHSLYSVEVTRHEHSSLFEAIVSELASKFPEYLVLQDALAPSDSSITPPELLSFVDQAAVADRLREIIDASPLLSSDASLKFRWRRMRNFLKEANIYVGVNSIWIRPYIYPLVSNSQYSQVGQCIYMSATIGDPADLSRQLGTRQISKIPVPQRFAEATSGRRLILMNRLNEEDIPLRLQQAILTALRKHPKSVWLCASGADATKYNGVVSAWLNANGMVGHRTWTLTSLGDEIEQFKTASAGHLFVGGRFDGMNFEGDECRLVVLTTLPRAINTQEEFFCAYLRDAAFMKKRLNNRVIQAMGRCNRSPEDFAIYVLCDPKFQTHFGKLSNRIGIPANIGAEIDMGEDISEFSEEELVTRVAAFLEGDFAEYDRHLRDLENGSPDTTDGHANGVSAQDEVTGWTALFASQNYHIAADRFEDCWDAAVQNNIIELGAYYGWCWAKARYLADRQDGADVSDALELLDRSIKRGGVSAWFNRMRASLARARALVAALPVATEESHLAVSRSFDELLEQTNTRGDRFQRLCNQIEEGLRSDHHNQYRDSVARLGALLGYSCSAPRHSSATDSLWRGVFSQHREVFTIELKIENTPSGKLAAADIGPVHNQVARARSEYQHLGYTVRPIIITHMTELFPDAASAAGEIRILSKELVLYLWDRVRALLTAYRDAWSLDDLAVRQRAAIALWSRLPPEGWLGRAMSHDDRFVTKDDLFAEWRT